MSLQADKTLVANIECYANTYYITDRYGITLDGNDYTNAVIEWGVTQYLGNFGSNFEISNFSMSLSNGEIFQDNGYLFDVTDIWSNKTVTVKRWTTGDTSFTSDCDSYVKGIIKGFTISGQSIITFDVDIVNEKDSKLLPSVIIEDQSNLTTAVEYASSVTAYAGTKLCNLTGNPSIFYDGELLFLKNDSGQYEYNYVETKSGNYLYLRNNLLYNYISGNNGTCYKPFLNSPSESVGKTVPIQIGDLGYSDNDGDGKSDYKGGVFGKAITVNGKIGEQAIVVDTTSQIALQNIGVWENSLQRFFEAQKERTVTSGMYSDSNSGQKVVTIKNPGIFYPGMTLKIYDDLASEINIIDTVSTVIGSYSGGVFADLTMINNLANNYTTANNGAVEFHVGEYEIGNSLNSVVFQVDSIATLSIGITNLNDIEELTLGSGEAKYITWINEESWQSNTDEIPELLSPSIIRIDNEIMLVIQAPDTSSDTIFVERGYAGTTKESHDAGAKIYQSSQFSSKNLITFRERFDAKVSANHYLGANGVTNSNTNPDDYVLSGFNNMFDGDLDTYFQYEQATTGISSIGERSWYSFDIKFDKIEDDYNIFSAYAATKIQGQISSDEPPLISLLALFAGLDSGIYSDEPTAGNFANFGNIYAIDNPYAGPYYTLNTWEVFDSDDNPGAWNLLLNGMVLTNLKDLNKRWKVFLELLSVYSGSSQSLTWGFKIYALGLWIEFSANINKRKLMCINQGRAITSDVITICGDDSPSRLGDLCENPVDVLALILTQELNYSTSDFTSNWSTARTYYKTGSNFSDESNEIPKCAFSYGIDDDRMEGWKFCEWIASHFNLALVKTASGTIDIVNLHEIYINTPSGNEINIEDILFLTGSGLRRFNIKQTGVDLIYNDVSLKWKRNNSTNDYQKIENPLQNISLASGDTLLSAREKYYSGKKRTLEIESPFIYNLYDAQRKAKWELNDKAESHFWIEFFLDFDHYLEKQSPPLSEQYKIGDMIYIVGKHGGINFTSSNLFYIQDIIFHDVGREIEIHAKSIQPVTAFETTATTGEFLYYDNGGDSWAGTVWNDNGGDSFAGDVYNDNGS